MDLAKIPFAGGALLGFLFLDLLFEIVQFGRAITEAQIIYRHVHDEPERLAQLCPDAHPQLRDLVTSMLAKNPENRPRGADAVARELAALLPDGPPPRRPVAASEDATALLPPVTDATAPLSILPMHDDRHEDRPAPGGAARGPRDRKALLLGGVLIGSLLALGLIIALLAAIGSSSDKKGADAAAATTAATSSAPASSAPAAAPTEKTPTPASSSASPKSTKPSASPSSAKPSTKGPGAALADDLNSAFAGASRSMRPQPERETRRDVAEITAQLRQGDLDEAADKARDLRRSLNEAQQRGRWDGDAQLMQVLSQVAAS
jgi:serine/threonine-protein kinase